MSKLPRLDPDRASRSGGAVLGAFAVIGLMVAGSAAAFAYTAGWLSPDRLTPISIVDALSERGGNPIGHRSNHARGICFTGTFEANGAGALLSKAPMFVAGRYPVVGRFAIATGNPEAPDATGRVRSLAIRVVATDSQEWYRGMNSYPVFVVSPPEEFFEQALAADIDPTTGKPNPAAMQRFNATHPDTAAFNAWAQTAPWTTSFADQAYNSLNAFRFIDGSGATHAVRWSLLPTEPAHIVNAADRAHLTPNFLEQDLTQRLSQGMLRWHMVVTLAAPDDPTNDATRAWPDDRLHVDVGTLVVERAEAEANGPCRDLNFDPLVLPAGIEPSDDPLLPARSSTYAKSFDRRTADAAQYPHTAPGGQE